MRIVMIPPLIAGTIAVFLTNRITSSFSLISEKMRQVNLSKTNELIEWNKNDEIGGLIREYNKMVAKLVESASALAKSEREGAWREMARQVAHAQVWQALPASDSDSIEFIRFG